MEKTTNTKRLLLRFSENESRILAGFLKDHGNCTNTELTIEISHDSGIGIATVVVCQCGGKQDITDYGIW